MTLFLFLLKRIITVIIGFAQYLNRLRALRVKSRVGKKVLEAKENVKKQLGRSLAKGDALLPTFAFPVSKQMNIPGQQQGKAITDYNPWA